MKVEFLKDNFKYYLRGMVQMNVSKKGDIIEVDSETADRWIKKSVAKIVVDKVEVKPVISNHTPDIELPDIELPIIADKPKKRGRKKKQS